jgi:hypothetical protein
MDELKYIERIAFDNATYDVRELPQEIQDEVLRYNAWTEEQIAAQRELQSVQQRIQLLQYARSAAYQSVQTIASRLEAVTPDETSTSAIVKETDRDTPQDSGA